jgi:hypothetical protein
MTNILTALTVGALTSGSMFAESAVSGNTQVPLGEALAVFVFASGCVWWLGRDRQKTSDDIRQIKTSIEGLQCNHHLKLLETVMRRLGRIEGKLNLAQFESLTDKEKESTP